VIDLLVQLTDIRGVEHLITEDAMQLGRILGNYVTLCGETIAPASLTAPPGRVCRVCRDSPLR
jgi:hypothetical protein